MEAGSFDPKGAAGAAKPQLQMVPSTLLYEVAPVLELGAKKYEPWNWRGNRVEVMTYAGAMLRHLQQFIDGEDVDSESGRSHIAHIAASCAIVLDARRFGTLVDNRPPKVPEVPEGEESCKRELNSCAHGMHILSE